jgi:hypothetical protein
MQGNDVPVPSYILEIFRDYSTVWNGNKTKDASVINTQQSSLQLQAGNSSSAE